RDTMTTAKIIRKPLIGACLQFQRFSPRQKQADMVLEKKLRVLHLDPQEVNLVPHWGSLSI
ncbi:hypothetical protein ACQP3L_28820, partial [Escherichia coli]